MNIWPPEGKTGNLQKYDRDPVITQAVQSRFATTLH